MKIIECLNKGKRLLEVSNDVEFDTDSKVILESILKVNRAKLLSMYNNDISARDFNRYMKLIKVRSKHKPIAYILGYKYFMNYKFNVKKGILIPRDDTEVLVRKVIEYSKDIKTEQINILDICTGSGCIAISLAKEIEKSQIIGLDVSQKAINVSKKNVRDNDVTGRVKIIKSNLFKSIDKVKYYDIFDIIVSNPPYIKTNIIKSLDCDVKDYEPILALDGGNDGLIFYKKIIEDGKKFLKNDGILAFEIDYTYTNDIEKLFKTNGYIDINVYKDLSNKDRVMIARLKK